MSAGRMALLLLVCAQSSPAQAPSRLVAGAGVAEYYGEGYVRRSPVSPSSFVFFRGERVTFRVGVSNLGDVPETLVTGTDRATDLFAVTAFKAPPVDSGSEIIERAWRNDRFVDETSVTLPLEVEPNAWKLWPGNKYQLDPGREFLLGPHEGVEWNVGVSTGDLTPGLYRVDLKIRALDSQQRPVLGFGRFSFDVRPRTAEARVELARRDALRHLGAENYVEARRAVATILALNPDSYFGHGALALIAEAEGKTDEATTHRNRARDVLRQRRDALLLQYKNADEIDQLTKGHY